MAFKSLNCFFVEFCKLQSRWNRHICGHNAWPACVCDYGNAIAAWNLSGECSRLTFIFIGKGNCIIKQFINWVNAYYSRLFKYGVIYCFWSSQSAGMRCRGPGTSGCSPWFYYQYRRWPVAWGYFFNWFDELQAFFQFFKIDHNDFCIFVIMHVAQKVKFIHICLVADGYELWEPEIPVCCKVEDSGA